VRIFTTLIETDELERFLAEPALAIVDCRFRLADTEWGAREHALAHIPGAVYAHLDEDLSGIKTGTNGRHPLPDPVRLSNWLGQVGIDGITQVVAYDQDTGMFASRLWWLLRWLGHDRAAVLDGGFSKWITEGRPTSAADVLRPARRFTASLRPDLAVSTSEVDELRHDSDWKIVDARAPERFRGENETLDKAAGHIPGAVNHFYMDNLEPEGTFLRPDVLRDQFERTLGGVPPDQAIVYCGSGVTACHDLLALEHAGLQGARLYAGSWSEWSSDPTRPIATRDLKGT
jgi:thiosulfate/3-mercaptopyruvate sulfurtransferase